MVGKVGKRMWTLLNYIEVVMLNGIESCRKREKKYSINDIFVAT
jgi:hypothetical protein